MKLRELERQLYQLIELVERIDNVAVPAEHFNDMKDECNAGEPGVALEDLCSQLDDYEVAVPRAVIDKICELGTAMGIKPSYWNRLRVTDGSEL